MNQDLEKLFTHLEPPEPPAELLGRILNSIQREKGLRAAKKRIAIFSLGVLGSLVAAIPVFQAAHGAVVESGFSHFLSLIFSDFGTVITFWDKFIFSIFESLPVMNVALLLAVIFIFLGSLKYLVKNIAVFWAAPALVNNSYGHQ